MPSKNRGYPNDLTLADINNPPQHINALADAIDADIASVAADVSTNTKKFVDIISRAAPRVDGPRTGNFKIQAGTYVGTTDSGGVLSVTFPVAYQCVLTVLCTSGDNNAAHTFTSDTVTKTGFRTTAIKNGSAVRSVAVRVEYIALGWV